jgi:hypothetical protein
MSLYFSSDTAKALAHVVSFCGVSMTVREWAHWIATNPNTVASRIIHKGYTPLEALMVPNRNGERLVDLTAEEAAAALSWQAIRARSQFGRNQDDREHSCQVARWSLENGVFYSNDYNSHSASRRGVVFDFLTRGPFGR